MTAAFNLSQLANNLNTSGQLDATDGLTGAVPVANGGTGRSTLTANNVILGNGTGQVQQVAPGTNGNVLTSNGTTWVSQSVPVTAIGVGQTWQNVKSSRAVGVTYTNTTGRPILVSISGNGVNPYGAVAQLTVDGSIVAENITYDSNAVMTAQAIVPSGSTYVGQASWNYRSWYELR